MFAFSRQTVMLSLRFLYEHVLQVQWLSLYTTNVVGPLEA